jgi:hypothetical protein
VQNLNRNSASPFPSVEDHILRNFGTSSTKVQRATSRKTAFLIHAVVTTPNLSKSPRLNDAVF